MHAAHTAVTRGVCRCPACAMNSKRSGFDGCRTCTARQAGRCPASLRLRLLRGRLCPAAATILSIFSLAMGGAKRLTSIARRRGRRCRAVVRVLCAQGSCGPFFVTWQGRGLPRQRQPHAAAYKRHASGQAALCPCFCPHSALCIARPCLLQDPYLVTPSNGVCCQSKNAGCVQPIRIAKLALQIEV